MKAPNGRLSGDSSAQAHRHMGVFGRMLPPNLFCALPNFVVLRKICFKRMIKTKIFPPKMYFVHQTLKRGFGRSSAKMVSAIRIFCFKGHSAWRCRITSKTFFYKSPLEGPGKHFRGSRVGLLRHCKETPQIKSSNKEAPPKDKLLVSARASI